MNQMRIIFRREFASYFATPLAYIFIVIFLILSGAFTFWMGNWYEREQADLMPFFTFHPWLYLFLVPALSMRLWSEERKSGTIELLMTLPITKLDAVLGKFLAAWVFAGIALMLTFPFWLVVNYLGQPDNGVILASYMGSWFMAGGFLAIGSCMSALTKSQVIAFILTTVVCFFFLMCGFPMVIDLLNGWMPSWAVDIVSSFSFITHFSSISKGVLELRDVLYFLMLMVTWLLATVIVIDLKKAD